jgi:hypothetical protein
MKLPINQLLAKFTLLLFILLAYFLYLTYQYDLLTGGVASIITWSFFVLCTPIADAGLLLDLPIRILFGIRMIWSEIVVWAIAILINVSCLVFFKQYYDVTFLTHTMKVILTNPIPYWLVILLSGVGTFLSIRFGDELMDVLHHRDRKFYLSHHFKHEIILFIFFLAILVGYYEIISTLDIDVK